MRRQLQTHREERRKAEAKKQANNVPLALREEKQVSLFFMVERAKRAKPFSTLVEITPPTLS